MPVPCHTWMLETLTMMMLLARPRPSQLLRGIKPQFFTPPAPSADALGVIMQKRAAIYVRVSTDKQTVENQVAALQQIAERRGWQVVEQYSDAGISGAKGCDGRPGASSMSSWLGRSLIDLLGTIQLELNGIDLYLDQQSIDTTTPAGKLFQVTGAFAEFERSMIRQRVHAGLKRTVAQGKQLGRSRIDAATEKRIQAQLRLGRAS